MHVLVVVCSGHASSVGRPRGLGQLDPQRFTPAGVRAVARGLPGTRSLSPRASRSRTSPAARSPGRAALRRRGDAGAPTSAAARRLGGEGPPRGGIAPRWRRCRPPPSVSLRDAREGSAPWSALACVPAVGRSLATTCSARSPTPVSPTSWLVAAPAALGHTPAVCAARRLRRRWPSERTGDLSATAASSGERGPP